MKQAINFRISAYQTGDRASPRFVWGVGIPVELIEQLPGDLRRIQLEADDDRMYVKFNGKGITAKLPNAGAPLMWTSHIGEHHLTGLTPPDEMVRAKGITGWWDDENRRLVVDSPPDVVKRAMERSMHHVPDTEQQFPGTHFSEDVQDAIMHNATGPSSFLQDTTTDAVIEEAAIESDPDSVTYQWFLAQVKKGQEAPFSEVVELTPELADILLRRNAGNRNIRATKLNQYISDISNDRWQLNGEALQVSREGELNNGQHRCSAVMAAHKSIRTFIAFGMTRESRNTVDVGATRTPADHLGVMGYKNATTLAGLTRFLLAYEASGERRDVSLSNRITAAAINERVPTDSRLMEAAHMGNHSSKARRLAPPSVLGFSYYMFACINEDDSKTFMDQFTTGAGLTATDPAYVARETLMNRPNLSRECKIEVLFRGWNAFRSKKSVRQIRIQYELPQLV